MGARNKLPVFGPGDRVEVQRGAGRDWETATYVGRYLGWRGRHAVTLDAARYVDLTTGREVDSAAVDPCDLAVLRTSAAIVLTCRLRRARRSP